MEIISDSANLLLNALVLGFAGALVLLAYVTLRPQASAFAAQDPVQEQPSLVEGNERIHQGAGQPENKGAERAA
jgi:hypothetical protein